VTISGERKARIRELYFNQAKTIGDIAKIERISIRDISAILNEEEVKQQKMDNHKRLQKQQEISAKY
jgi:hypothetical protein